MIDQDYITLAAYCDSCHESISPFMDRLHRSKWLEHAAITRDFHAIHNPSYYHLCVKCWEKALAVLNLPMTRKEDGTEIMADGTEVPWQPPLRGEGPCHHPVIADGGERGMVCHNCGDQFEIVPRSNDQGESSA